MSLRGEVPSLNCCQQVDGAEQVRDRGTPTDQKKSGETRVTERRCPRVPVRNAACTPSTTRTSRRRCMPRTPRVTTRPCRMHSSAIRSLPGRVCTWATTSVCDSALERRQRGEGALNRVVVLLHAFGPRGWAGRSSASHATARLSRRAVSSPRPRASGTSLTSSSCWPWCSALAASGSHSAPGRCPGQTRSPTQRRSLPSWRSWRPACPSTPARRTC
jgi:hypothetical protein